MCSFLTLLCNSRIFVIDIYYLYLHELYSTGVSDMYFKFSLYSHFIPRMIIRVILVPWHRFQYSNICSSMMSIHPKGGGSMWDTRVSLINVDMVSGLIKCCCMSPFHIVCRGS